MSYSRLLKQMLLGAPAGDLEEADAYALFAAMLDDGVPDVELGAILLALRIKDASLGEMVGFYRALSERIYPLYPPHGALRPVVIPTYHPVRGGPNLTALLALMLGRFGVPVLLHGTLESAGRATTAAVLRALGIMPCARLDQAQAALAIKRLAFIPTAALSPGIAHLLIQRARLGIRNVGHRMLPLLDPFFGESVRLVSSGHPVHLARLRQFLAVTESDALVVRGTQGEPFLSPGRRVKIELFERGVCRIYLGPAPGDAPLLPASDVLSTAAWIREVLERRRAAPTALVSQAACCLYASGFTASLAEAQHQVAAAFGLAQPQIALQSVA